MRTSAEIKYKYAVNAACEVIDIAKLSETDRKDYECAGCSKIVRPVLGKNRKKHFRHKVAADCSVETYLHRMGKMLFERCYIENMEKRQPFYVEFLQPLVCMLCKLGPCDVGNCYRSYDLTKAFNEIKIEYRDGNLIPDIYLRTSSGEVLYVEIWVKHAVTDEKINSGKKIIEICIQNEEDLQIFSSGLISCRDNRVKFYNFSPKPIQNDAPELCNKQVIYFAVSPNGKCAIVKDSQYRFYESQNNKECYVKDVLEPSSKAFIQEVEAAYNKGAKVKNCFLCRYHALAKPYQRENDGEPIFCKFLKKTIASNFAAECEYYKPDPKVFGEQRYAKQSSASNRSRDKLPDPPSPIKAHTPVAVEESKSTSVQSPATAPEQTHTAPEVSTLNEILSNNDDVLSRLMPENAKPYEFLATCIYCGKVTADWWSYDGDGKCKCQECYRTGLK